MEVGVVIGEEEFSGATPPTAEPAGCDGPCLVPWRRERHGTLAVVLSRTPPRAAAVEADR